MEIRYVGPHDEVGIAATGQIVARDGTVHVDDDELAAALLEQPDNWQPAKPQAVKPAADIETPEVDEEG